jgi:hypothetical protein
MRKYLLGFSLTLALIVFVVASAPYAAGELRETIGTPARLALSGQSCGMVRQASGGDASVQTSVLPDGQVVLGATSYSNIKMLIGFGMGPLMYQWISDSWQNATTSGGTLSRDGALTFLDAHLAPVSQKTFTKSLIAETTIPACDTSSTATGFLAVSIAPTSTLEPAFSGMQPLRAEIPSTKTWNQANFRLEIDGLECTHVGRIDAFTVRREVLHQKVGADRPLYVVLPGKLILPHLKITFPLSDAPSWTQWWNNLLQTGNAPPKAGQLVLLAADLRTPLATIKFTNLRIVSLAQSAAPLPGGVAAKTAELICDQMSFAAPGG